MSNALRFSLSLLITLVISGCGFQLKGSQDYGKNTLNGAQISVVSAEPRSELTSAVLQQLALAGAEVVAPAAGVLTIKLGAERFTQRKLALTAQARAAEIGLTLRTQ